MRRTLLERLGKEWLFCDGGTGTILQSKGLRGGELPETWNLKRPEDIIDLHCGYLRAGCDIFNTNTFGANALKFPDTLEQIVTEAVRLAQEARRRTGRNTTIRPNTGGSANTNVSPAHTRKAATANCFFPNAARRCSRTSGFSTRCA